MIPAGSMMPRGSLLIRAARSTQAATAEMAFVSIVVMGANRRWCRYAGRGGNFMLMAMLGIVFPNPP